MVPVPVPVPVWAWTGKGIEAVRARSRYFINQNEFRGEYGGFLFRNDFESLKSL
jgi:hypothetical protein